MNYDAELYEQRALVYVSKQLQSRVETNVNILAVASPFARRTAEVDGLIHDSRGILGVEVKSFAVDRRVYDEVIRKYDRLEIRRLVLVAPSFADDVTQVSRCECLPFLPEIEDLTTRQTDAIESFVFPPPLMRELASGQHHFRYRLALRSGQNRAFANQVSKRIDCTSKLIDDLRRISSPIMRVYWSKCRYLFPKDAFYRERELYRAGGFAVIDIDGSTIHNHLFPCYITPEHPICPACRFFADETRRRAEEVLHEQLIENTLTLNSGRRGVHIYLPDAEDVDLNALARLFKMRKVKVDMAVLTDLNGVIGFPGSWHGVAAARVGDYAL